jgi:hypothetical protein
MELWTSLVQRVHKNEVGVASVRVSSLLLKESFKLG